MSLEKRLQAAEDGRLAFAMKHLSPRDGVALIQEERDRQVRVEGWTSEHDDCHTYAQMGVQAARLTVYYTDAEVVHVDDDSDGGYRFPGWKRPEEYKDDVRRLVVAGALIAAEIDRLLRAAPQDTKPVAPESADTVKR